MIPYVAICIVITALVTYSLRAIPLLIFRKPIQSLWIRSFLFYVPWTVLTAMTIPSVFYATSSIISATIGLVIALVLSYMRYNLLVVALLATSVAWITEVIILSI